MSAENKENLTTQRGAWLVVGVFLLAYIFSFIDRMIIGLMVEPLRRDLGLSDTQISLLQGLGFAVFYTLVGLPIGRFVDRYSRVGIAAIGVALWSAMTAFSGLAQTYWHLLLARMGVGIGEATLSPAANSLFADLFDRRQLGLALGVYNVGSAIGAAIAMILGGYIVHFASGQQPVMLPLLGEIRPWQMTFFYVGLPGLLVALLVWALPEPPRRSARGESAAAAPPLSEVLAFARRTRSALTWHHLAVGFSNFATFAIVSWIPIMLVRAYGWTIAQAGLAIGIALLIGGTIGLIGGGWAADRATRGRGAAGRMGLGVLASLLGIPSGAMLGQPDSALVAVALFTVTYMFAISPISAGSAALQEMTPPRMRGQLTAFYLFAINIIGIGIGSTAVALLSDNVFTQPDGIRYSLSVVAPVGLLLAAICYAMAMRPVGAAAAAQDPTS